MRVALLLGSLGSFFNLYQLQAMFPQLSERFGTSITEAGWLNMATLGGMMLTAPFTGAATARLNPYNVLVAGFLFLATLNVAIAFSPNQELLFGLRFVQGVVIPFLLTASMQLIASEKTPQGIAVSLYVVGTIVGSTLSRFYPAWAAEQLEWELAFLCAAGFLALAALTVFLTKILFQNPSSRLSVSNEPIAGQAKRALFDKGLVVAYLVGFSLLFTQSSIFTALGIRLAEEPYLWQPDHIGMIYLACLPALIFVLASKPIKLSISTRTLAVGLLCLTWFSLFVMGVSFSSIMIGVMLFAIATYMMQTVTAGMLSDSKNVPASIAAGFYLTFYYFGGAIGAIISTYVYEAWGWKGVIACVAIVQVVVVCLILCVRHSALRRLHHACVKA